MIWTLLGIFAGGVALNLTPCVYPMIPITVSFFGGRSTQGKPGQFTLVLHGLCYLMGLALTNSTLGVVAALTGGLMGSLLQSPIVLALVAGVLVVFATSLFGFWELRLPGSLTQAASKSYAGYFGSLFMGLTLGVVAAPCIGPFVLGLLTYVGNRGDVFLGFSLFFVLALGLGVPFLLLGIFSGSLNKLPRSGAWMVWVRTIFGFILLAMAVYFLKPLFPNPLLYNLALAMTMFVAGLYLSWLEPSVAPGKAFRYLRTWAGIFFFAAAVFVAGSGIKSAIETATAGGPGSVAAGQIAWETYSEDALARAKADGRPVFIDSYADWCIPCKELDKFTFSQPEVVVLSRNFVMLKGDLTVGTDPKVKAMYAKFGVKGVPTLVFIDAAGRELTELRGTGFEKKEVFLPKLRKALEAGKE